jgi:REP element-mobilizing transposase RayT
MPQSLAQVYLHLVFSTKNRIPALRGIEEKMHAYLVGACNNLESPSLIIGGVEDHVHILCRQSKNIALKDLVGEVKRESSKWIKTQGQTYQGFYWQSGYGAFSVSPSHVVAVKTYIGQQREHHAQVTFQDEFRRICKKYGLELDERYAWA